MSTMPFRFAVQATPQDGPQWLATARRAEDLGYATLMMPDGMQLLSPLPALALAAGATSSLRVGTFVLASALRPPGLVAWDAHSLSVLSGGRFEFGIGTGRPEVVEQAVRLAGQPPTTGAERLARVGQTIDALRELDSGRHTPVLMAAGGPRARALAAAKADIVTLAIGPLTSREEAARLAAEVREAAGTRAGSIEFESPIFVVGDEAPPWVLVNFGSPGLQRTRLQQIRRRNRSRFLRGGRCGASWEPEPASAPARFRTPAWRSEGSS